MKIINSFSIVQSLKVTCLKASVVVFMSVFFDFNASVEACCVFWAALVLNYFSREIITHVTEMEDLHCEEEVASASEVHERNMPSSINEFRVPYMSCHVPKLV